MRLAMSLAALALCGLAPPKVVDSWNGGPKTPAYHRVLVDCETLTHTHGRNAVYGRWEAPLAGVNVRIMAPAEAGAGLRVDCREGDCIRAGRMEATPGRLATHVIPFDTLADAQAMSDAIAALRKACAGEGQRSSAP